MSLPTEENLFELRRFPTTGQVINLVYGEHQPTRDIDDYLERFFAKIRKEIEIISPTFAEIVVSVSLRAMYGKDTFHDGLFGGSYVVKLFPARSARFPKWRPLSDLLCPTFERFARNIKKVHARKIKRKEFLEITEGHLHVRVYRTVDQVKGRGRVRSELMKALHAEGGAARLELAKDPFYSIDKFYSPKLYCKTCKSVISRIDVKRHTQTKRHRKDNPNSTITHVPMVLWF